MKVRNVFFITLCVTVLHWWGVGLFVPACAKEYDDEQVPNVVILTLLSVHREYTIDDPIHQYMPHLFKEMTPEGTLYTDLVDGNVQFHIPVVQAINTGLSYETVHGRIGVPSVYQYMRKKFSWPVTKIWSIGDWSIGDFIYEGEGFSQNTLPCRLSRHFELSAPAQEIMDEKDKIMVVQYNELLKNPVSSKSHWDSMGKVQYSFFNKIMATFKPKFIHYILDDVESAHYDTLAHYLLAIRRSDDIIFQTWRFIQSDPFYRDRTYLIVSTDHLRNRYYMQHHNNGFDHPSHVWLYIYGPDIGKGKRISRPISHKDIFATVVKLYRLDTHAHEGSPLNDAFRE